MEAEADSRVSGGSVMMCNVLQMTVLNDWRAKVLCRSAALQRMDDITRRVMRKAQKSVSLIGDHCAGAVRRLSWCGNHAGG